MDELDIQDQSVRHASKISIKYGNIEVSFEGTESYIKNHLPELIELLQNLPPHSFNEVFEEESEELIEIPPSPEERRLKMTTNNIASRLDVKTGPQLVLAACAHLCLVKGAETFERKNILAEMKTASNYYKESHCSNLSSSLANLVKDNKLIERSNNNYALTAATIQELEALLA